MEYATVEEVKPRTSVKTWLKRPLAWAILAGMFFALRWRQRQMRKS